MPDTFEYVFHISLTNNSTSILFYLGNFLKYLIKSYIYIYDKSCCISLVFSKKIIIFSKPFSTFTTVSSFPQMYIHELTKAWNILNYLQSVVMNTICYTTTIRIPMGFSFQFTMNMNLFFVAFNIIYYYALQSC